MRYAAGHKARTRTRLVQEAAQSIRRHGVGGTSIDSVTAAAGLTRGGFYAHFGSREEMIAAGVAEMVGQSRIIPADGAAARDPAAALAAYVDFYLSPSHRDSLTASCALPLLVSEAVRLPAPARTQLAQGATHLSAMLEIQLRRLGFDDPQAEASSVLAELVGATTLARAEQDLARSEAWLTHSRISVRRRLGLAETPAAGMRTPGA